MKFRPLPLQLVLCLFAGIAHAAPTRAAHQPVKASSASNGVSTPSPGSPERKVILDTLRVPVQKSLKQAVVFYEVELKVKNSWAYVHAMPRDKNGKKLKGFEAGVEPGVQALLRKSRGRWRVLTSEVGTDMAATANARRKFPQAPHAIFPSMPDDFPGDGPSGGSGYNNK